MKSFPKLSLLGVLAIAATACITVNIYFPAPQVRAAAEQIVEETWGEGAAAGDDSAPAEALPSGPGAFLNMLAPRSAHAQDHPDVNVSTAAIRALKATMKTRADELKPYMAKGAVGIGKDGMLVARDLSGLPLGDQAKIRRLLDAENRDRKALYAEIAEANGYERDRVDDIQKIFAETWIQKAEHGWPIQKPDGSWAAR
jgi:uncharacterized protein YdbL (DUF1318 family)